VLAVVLLRTTTEMGIVSKTLSESYYKVVQIRSFASDGDEGERGAKNKTMYLEHAILMKRQHKP
jgi:hypothetical protein